MKISKDRGRPERWINIHRLTLFVEKKFTTFALLKNEGMNPFKAYQIPFLGLKTGFHDFEFELDNAFFAAFEHSEIQSGDLKANLTLEKQSTMLVLDFQVEGVVEGVCDQLWRFH